MPIHETFLAELEHEIAGLRRTVERVPDDELDWAPHERSMTFRGLVTHTVHIPNWGTRTVVSTEFDVAPDGESMKRSPVESVAEALDHLDRNAHSFREALLGATDEDLTAIWTLEDHGRVIFSMPRIGVLRSMVMNHLVHHRAQLCVYLRMKGVPVPALYGPSADEDARRDG